MIGIGGAGMSGIATVLRQQGYVVSGSDLRASEVTRRLQGQGIQVALGHDAANLPPDAELVIVSSAVGEDNPELVAAVARGVPVIKRGEMLARLVNAREGIAVAGAHGKTTTTAMVALVLEQAGLSPSFIIGGELQHLALSAKLGQGPHFVAEADESDASFLALHPRIAVVTNVEDDHLDYYRSLERLQGAFRQFVQQVRPDGFALLCGEDPCLQAMRDQVPTRVLYYGFQRTHDYALFDYEACGYRSQFGASRNGRTLGRIELQVPGVHNALNALAATAVGMELGLGFEVIREALAEFVGAKRRFEVLGQVDGVTVLDDYAHHPTEIAATLAAARQAHPGRLVVIFQPHRYSRTRLLGEQFGPALRAADVVVVTDVYGAGEAPIPEVSGEIIHRSALAAGCNATYVADLDQVPQHVRALMRPGDLVITMGAGDIRQVGLVLVKGSGS